MTESDGKTRFRGMLGFARKAGKTVIGTEMVCRAMKIRGENRIRLVIISDKASDADAAQTAALENEALQYEGKTSGGVSFADLLLQSLATNENINQSSKLAAHIRMLASKTFLLFIG